MKFPTPAPRLIGLSGMKQSGKDTVAQIIMEQQPSFVRLAFADPMKAMALAINPLIVVDVDDWEKLPDFAGEVLAGASGIHDDRGFLCVYRLSEVVERLGWEAAKKITDVRVFLQRLGTEGGRRCIHENVWVDRTMADVIQALNDHHSVVITDVRFRNEIRSIQLYGGQLWRVNRLSLQEDTSATGKHTSEHEWRSVVPDRFIENNGTLADLQVAVREALRKKAS